MNWLVRKIERNCAPAGNVRTLDDAVPRMNELNSASGNRTYFVGGR